MLFFSIKATAQRKGFYFNIGVGATKQKNINMPMGSVNLGFSFGKNIVSIYNQAGLYHVKLAGIEHNYIAKLNKKTFCYSIISLIPFNTYIAGNRIGRSYQNEGNFAFDFGSGMKYYISKKTAITASIRASVFNAENYNDNKTNLIIPLTICIGVGK